MFDRKKDFDAWNVKKKSVHEKMTSPFFHEREIWWCSLGVNIGFEEDGSGSEYYRPVLVLKGISRQTCFVIPLTTSRNPHRLRPPIGQVGGKEARALISQMRIIDTKRLVSRICHLDTKVFASIRKAVRGML